MNALALLADEHVKRAFITALRANGYDVAAVHEEYPGGLGDAELLDRCLDEGRIMLTNDDDFVRLARTRDHAGIVAYSDQNCSPAEIVRGITRIDRHLDDEAMRNHVEWLENWL